jgi:hypothetical protein
VVCARQSSAGSKVRAGVAVRRAVSDDVAPKAIPASAAEAATLTAPSKVRWPDVFVPIAVSCG